MDNVIMLNIKQVKYLTITCSDYREIKSLPCRSGRDAHRYKSVLICVHLWLK